MKAQRKIFTNEFFTNRLKEQGIPYITHDNIIHKHLY